MKKQIKTIVILGGGLFKNSSGRWRTTLGEKEGDKFGLTNTRLRVLAAAALWEKDKNLVFIASGGQGQLKDSLPADLTIAKVIKNELTDLGVPTEKIITEEKSGSTYGQLCTLAEMIEKSEISGEISIISNEWHLPRIKAMTEHGDLKKTFAGKKINLIAAEDILLQLKTEEWKKFIEKTRNNPAMKRRVENEKGGIEQIKKGLYKFARK